jgi:DNA invertase Pin-like site-specific DNA recombinase
MLIGSLAEFERSIIRERTLAGLEAARARGRHGARPRAFAEKDWAVLKTLLRNLGLTVQNVARRLKVALSTLYRHLPGGRSALERP